MIIYSTQSLHHVTQVLFYLIFTTYDTDMTISLILQIKRDLSGTPQTKTSQPVSDKARIQVHIF